MSYRDHSGNSSARPNNPFGEIERAPTEEERIVSQILDVQQESKGSTQRSLALLYQTEEIGTATAEQIIEQGEKLDRIEGTVTQIDADLKQSQKHINGLKSVFGGVTNWWQARKEKKQKKKEGSEPPSSFGESGLKSAMKQQAAPYQATRSVAGSSSSSSGISSSSTESPATRRPRQNAGAGTSVHDVIEQNEQDITDDLDEMSNLTDRLKYMAVAMGEEMDKQNAQIDRITDHVGRTEGTMTGQNKEMNRILRK